MTFISYAQNYEDVMLHRALKDIKKGFYIDVGANDPDLDSVSKAFYEMGWCGINIEPVTKWYQKLVEKRPNDINLEIAVSDTPGALHFFEIIDTGLSTLNKEICVPYLKEGFKFKEITVPALTLDAICESYDVDEIHFLKVDVEGAEPAVLRSINLKRIRPWIILVEATKPNSQIENYENWEPLLTNQEYEFVYFDGLNRFYVAREKHFLKKAFNIPPNYFDFFIRASEWGVIKKIQLLENELNSTKELTDRLDQQLTAILHSRSWRITKLLRSSSRIVRKLANKH